MKPTDNPHSLKDRFADQLDAWQSHRLLAHPLNGDLSSRIVASADDADWQSCPIDDTEIRLLEYRGGNNPRFTALLRLAKGVSQADLGCWRKLEALVLNGALDLQDTEAISGCYVRVPALQHALKLSDGDDHWPIQAQLYVAFAGGHYPKEDEEPRSIDTQPDSAWLPGPIDGIEVMPLHVHGSANAMLLRWTESVSFRPTLDPKGEELLVLQGQLADEHGHYEPGTWIRNPEVDWQHWSARQGTVVFYKSGHFHASDSAHDKNA